MKNSKKKLISIIMPVYNAEKFLNKSIESILYQTYKNFEFIIINDGSSDGSKKIIEKYLYDKRIKFFSLKKKGIVICLNYALKKSKGDYIARMDADDISHHKRLEKQVNFLNSKTSYDIVGSRAKYIGGISLFSKLVHSSSKYCKASIIFKNPFIHPSIMIRKKTLNSLGGYKDYFKSEDYELWSRLFERFKGKNLKENLIKYRVHQNQHGIDDKNKEKYIKLVQKKWLKKLNIKNLEKKIKTHYELSIFNEKFIFDKNFKNYKKYLSWILTLKRLNNKNLFDVNSFNNILFTYYLGITVLFAGHGLKTYRSFKSCRIYKRKMIINFIILLFCYFKIKNFYVKKFFWYIIQIIILK